MRFRVLCRVFYTQVLEMSMLIPGLTLCQRIPSLFPYFTFISVRQDRGLAQEFTSLVYEDIVMSVRMCVL